MRPVVDGLEGRELLSATPIVLAPTAADARVATYRTGNGAKVIIQVHGPGNLAGTNLDSAGRLNLVYGGTSGQSKILVTVSRGSVPLESISEHDISIYNFTGIGGQLVGSLIAPQLDLVSGGQINMTSGVGRLQLRSIGGNTEVHLRDLPQTFLATLTNAPSTSVNINNVTSGSSATGTSAGVTNTINNVTGTSTSPGGTTTELGSNNIIANGPTIALGQTTNIPTFITSQTFVSAGGSQVATIPPGETAVTPLSQVGTGTPSTYTFAGRTQTYSTASDGSTTLTSVTGLFTPTANLISTPNPANPGPNPQPPGVLFQVGAVIGTGGTIGAGAVYGYDPVLNSLVEFNTVDGSVMNIVPVGGTSTGAAGVGLGRVDRQIVVLLARGTTVQVFDASTGAAMGSFSTTSLAPLGFDAVDGVAFTGTSTVLSDSTVSIPVQPQGTTDFGIMVAIDVKKSLAAGSAVTAGSPFVTENGFSFASDPTGIGETNNAYMFGASPLNLNEVPYRQAVIQTVSNLNSSNPRQVSQLVLPNPSNPQGVTPNVNFGGVVGSGPLTGLGSPLGGFETLLGIDRGVASNGTNFVRLYNPYTLAAVDSISLQDPDQLVALSETFHPELKGSALIDVQGNVSAFNANSATGMVLNDQGNLNLVQIGTTSNSEIVGEPLGHVQMPRRSGEVVLVTTSRSVGTRNGVVIVPSLRTLGTLSLPS
jgi:hypothetical protein